MAGSTAAPWAVDPAETGTDRVGGVPYHRALVHDRRRVGRGVAAIVLVVVGLFGFGSVITWLAAQADLAMGRVNPTLGGDDVTVLFQAAGAASIALLIPWSMLVQRWLYGVRGRSLISVVSRFRFDRFGWAFLFAGPLSVLCIAIVSLVTPVEPAQFNSADLIGLLAVTLLLTPLQAAGEEFGFRGLVLRVASSWNRNPRTALVVGVVVSAALFGAIHFQGNLWLNLNYLTLGVGAALITWRTGGLETAVVLHALNNTVSFTFALVLHTDLLGGTGEPALLLLTVPTIATTAAVFATTRRHGSTTARARPTRL
ncbi:CPBP family intramembrane metalloprotease [Saccharopolyspora gloriosae]|uniref:Membrane protease YdiL (CAAX protease family) n=1 Tax=Saccharopolyspora gloriosae TaxID=455344 RepID=A0A840NT21_9PSEU|nr:CPBP family intramembrane glutamic endopeptidase [Saccharopolyspora gloriosae]MBB5072429.1 membrane protease YdiL (CAAX protease family) [Saccharopolyspora gloriosae]